MEQRIHLPFIYDFESALIRLAQDPVHDVHLEKQRIRIPMDEGNIITLQSFGTKKEPVFYLTGAISRKQIEKIQEIFHFNHSLDEITAHFMQTDLAPLFKRFEGMPLIRSFSLYGRLMKGIIHQQLNKSFANTLTMRFVQTYGAQIEGVWVYPKPEVIAELSVDDLRMLQLSERKSDYMIGLSQSVAQGELNLSAMEMLEEDEVISRLTTYRGIGPWTAQNFLLFGLGRLNLFPIADVGLQNALKKLWKWERKPTKEEIQKRLPDWEPYLSYAALYLWKSIE